ncbi:hypothetical protein M3Y99_00336800 [Aphelenchoides fujianensis]|nr:hypothetical protein M3Y99_00336800 [Aphelenchoides fujianensis]
MRWLGVSFLLLISNFRQCWSECPRKHEYQKAAEDAASAQPPGYEPPEQFLQTSFIYNDQTDDDREYTIVVTEKLRELRQKLKQFAKLTVDNENLDCADHNYPKCREFPPRDSYHFLIIEDADHGAVVYSVDRKHNQARPGVVENALLDALSRHSAHSLMSYASEEAEKAVGFVREVTVEELEKFQSDNQALNDLLNERILELRSAEADESPVDGLKVFRAGELHELIDLNEKRPVFALFWTNVNAVSVHVFLLWRRVVARVQKDEKIRSAAVFGSVPCHQQVDLCTAFGIFHQDHRTVFAYRGSRKFASQYAIGDEEFYDNWIRMVIYGSPHRLELEEELKDARRGLLREFPTASLPRPAVTVGVFPTEESEEFQRFEKLSRMLYGRYHFVYYIQPTAESAVLSTFRPMEKTKRADYAENFEMSSLLAHITQNSIPSVLNFSTGFTGDIVYRSSKPIVLLVHDGEAGLLQELTELATNVDLKTKYFLAHIDRSYSYTIDAYFKKLEIESSDLPLLQLLEKEHIKTITSVKSPLRDVLKELQESKDVKSFELERTKAHPLKSFQLAHINHVFGVQEVKLLPEPIISTEYAHDRGSMDMGAAGGCPMMAHLGGGGGGHARRDEL